MYALWEPGTPRGFCDEGHMTRVVVRVGWSSVVGSSSEGRGELLPPRGMARLGETHNPPLGNLKDSWDLFSAITTRTAYCDP